MKGLDLLVFTSLIILAFSCTNKSKNTSLAHGSFTTAKWLESVNHIYPYRNQMLQNLIDSVPLKQMNYQEVIKLLGKPDRTEDGHLYYKIGEKKFGDFILSTKTFVIKLRADSTVEWRKIHGG